MNKAYDKDNRFFSMAEVFDKMAPYLVPQYDFLQNEAINLLHYNLDDSITVVDLGGGSGLLIKKILDRFNNSRCILVDYSEQFMDIAKEKLRGYTDRVTFVKSALEENWEDKIACKADALFSMSAIHHFTSQEKKDLYRRCHEVLNPGGWFINIDEMKTVYPDAYMKNMKFWLSHVRAMKNEVPETEQAYYDMWNEHFGQWEKRNVHDVDKEKVKGDDIHDPFIDQVAWLHQIGYKNVDIYIKYHLWSVLAGQK